MIKLSDLFDFVSGVSASSLDIKEIKTEGTIALIRPSNTLSNVIVGYVDKESINNENIVEKGNIMISTDGEGSHSYSYVLDFDFIPNSNVIGLRPKIDLTIEQKLFYALCITSNRYRYSYGRKPKGDRLKELLVPSLEELPRWANEESDILKYYENLNVKQSWNEKNNVNVLHRDVLDTSDWKEFKLVELFDIVGVKDSLKVISELEPNGKYPYVTKQTSNNGVAGYFDYYTEEGNVIVISDIVPYCSYQKENFSSTCHVHKLVPKSFKLNEFIGLFLSNIINVENYKYNYGRLFSRDKIKNTIIKLPSKEINGVCEPNWEYMEQFIKSLPYSCSLGGKIGTKFRFCPNGDIEVIVESLFDEVKNDIELNIDSWKEFKLSDLFDIYKCKQKNKEIKKVPLITATSFNNGVKEYIETDIYEKGNKITVTCNGACGDAFYQKNDFQSNGDVGILSPKFDMTDDIALFICKIIEAEKFKYSYGRKYNLEKLNSTVIKLPELNGQPNYEWMGKFIKSLPYSCCLGGKS